MQPSRREAKQLHKIYSVFLFVYQISYTVVWESRVKEREGKWKREENKTSGPAITEAANISLVVHSVIFVFHPVGCSNEDNLDVSSIQVAWTNKQPMGLFHVLQQNSMMLHTYKTLKKK